jgi:LPXTG-site transpeptidase (sortase) family protein
VATLTRQKRGEPPTGYVTKSVRMRRRRRRNRIAAIVSRTGELFITGGVVVLLFVVYLLWWTDVLQAKVQHQLVQTIEQEWTEPSSPAYTLKDIPLGSGVAVIYIPRFGSSYHQVVVEGTNEDDLAKGPGHYSGTPLPGAVGNVAIAGHRTTHGHPFKQMATLEPGDEVVLETGTAWYTYRAETEIAVDPTAGFNVVTSAPPSVAAHGRWPAWSYHTGDRDLTLTTCTPEFSAAQRLILHAVLIRTDPKNGSVAPPALQPHQGLEGDRY